jgi:hypothetical protein
VRARARILLIAALLCLPPGVSRPSPAEGQDVVVRDQQGNVAGALTPGKDGARSLVIFDRDGTVRALVEIGPDGSPTLSLVGKDGTPRLRLLPDGSLRLLPGDNPVVASPEPASREGLLRPGREGANRVALTDPSLIPWVLGLGALLLALLGVIILLEWRSFRWGRTLEDLGRTFAEDRQRERDAYSRVVVGQTEQAAEQRTLDEAEAAATELIRALERARAEVARMTERLQGRGPGGT